MNALFEIGQKVVCVDSSGRSFFGRKISLVEGKVYTVENNWILHEASGVYGITLVGIKLIIFRQTRFVPLDFDRQADEAIHEALKGQKTLTN